MRYNSILETIGDTPIVRLNRLAPKGVDVYVKVESFNPMASVKDRLAYAIITDARASGALQPGQTVVEATSGNTGIALAMVCAALGPSLCGHHGRNLLRRAPQDHARSWRQGDSYPCRGERFRHGQTGRGARG